MYRDEAVFIRDKKLIDLELYKKKFLKKYNPNSSKDVALRSAIKAAVQHNKLYVDGLPQSDREDVRTAWKDQMIFHIERLKPLITVEGFERAVEELWGHMNNQHERYFDKQSGGFRISHSQKSLSVYIKHLWCMNDIDEPEICPVDRIILSNTEAKIKNDISWGSVNSMNEHRRKFSYIQKMAVDGSLSVAQWELISFSSKES